VCVIHRYIYLAIGSDDRSWIGRCQLDHVDPVRHAVHDRCTVLRRTGHFHTAIGWRLYVSVRGIRTAAGVPLLVGRHARVCVCKLNSNIINDTYDVKTIMLCATVLCMHTLFTVDSYYAGHQYVEFFVILKFP